MAYYNKRRRAKKRAYGSRKGGHTAKRGLFGSRRRRSATKRKIRY